MKRSRSIAKTQTAALSYLVTLSLLLVVAGCSGPVSEEVVAEGTPAATLESETAAAELEAGTATVTPQPAAPDRPIVERPATTPAARPSPVATPAARPPVPEALAEAPAMPPPVLADAVADMAPLTAAPSEPAAVVAPPAPPALLTVPAGSRIAVLLIDALSSSANRPGDEFLASLAEPIVVNGEVAVDEGVRFRGRIVQVQEAGRVQGRANIQLVLTQILPPGNPISISTRPFIEEAESDVRRDATLGGLGAAAGAAIGAITGGGKGAAIGAVAGGAGTVAATRGRQLEYPAETRLVFELDRAVELPRLRPSQPTTGDRLGF